MPEPLDFDAIAKGLLNAAAKDAGKTAITRARLVKQLRHVWNARGAADRVTLSSLIGDATTAWPFVKTLDRAVRKLDR